MNEEELQARAAELAARAEELERRECELTKREEEVHAREERLAAREADAGGIAQTIKEEFEKKLEAQKQEFEERLNQRDEVIRQLASGENPAVDDDSPFAQLNKARLAQKAA